MSAQDDKDDKRLTAASARALLHGHFTAAARNPGDGLTIKDRTTDDIWKRLGIQVFRVTGPTHLADETFVIQNGKIHGIGMNFGGDGVTSMTVGATGKDVDKKKAVLVYAFNWGSGVHRSQLGVFDPRTANQILLPVSNYSFHDFEVKGDAEVVHVLAGNRRVGTVTLDETEGVLSPAFRIAEGTPAEIRDKIRAK